MSSKADPNAAAAPAAAAPVRPKRDQSRLVVYGILALASLGLFLNAMSLPSSKWEPLGSGTFPGIILFLLTILCLAGVAQEMRRQKWTGPGVAALARSHRLVIFTFFVFAIYIAVLPIAGFALSTFAFLSIAQLGLAPRTWGARLTALVLALIFSFGLPWLFADAFGIYLPRATFFG